MKPLYEVRAYKGRRRVIRIRGHLIPIGRWKRQTPEERAEFERHWNAAGAQVFDVRHLTNEEKRALLEEFKKL